MLGKNTKEAPASRHQIQGLGDTGFHVLLRRTRSHADHGKVSGATLNGARSMRAMMHCCEPGISDKRVPWDSKQSPAAVTRVTNDVVQVDTKAPRGLRTHVTQPPNATSSLAILSSRLLAFSNLFHTCSTLSTTSAFLSLFCIVSASLLTPLSTSPPSTTTPVPHHQNAF